MKTTFVALSDAKAHLSKLVEQVQATGTPVGIKKHDTEAVVLVRADVFSRLKELEDKMISAQLRAALTGRKYDLEEVLRELNLV